MKEKWSSQSLGEICEILDKFRIPISKKNRKRGPYPYYGASGIVDFVHDYLFDERLVLVGEDGAKWESGENTAFIINGKSWVNNHAHVLRPKRDVVKDEWIVYYLNYSNLLEYVTGLTVPKLNQRNLKSIQIPVPPLPEQERIVAILDQAFEKIDRAQANIEKNIGNAEELFQSKLDEVFSQTGEGWEEKKLGEVGKVSMCKRILKKQTNPESGIPFYKIGTFGKEPNAYIPEQLYNEFKRKYSFPKKGDVLISASGTIGRRVVYDGKPAYFQDSNIVWIDNDESLVSNEYLYEFYAYCDWNPSKGATISRLYNDDLRSIKIRFPQRKAQKEIVKGLRELNKRTELLRDGYHQKLDNLMELKRSILSSAFSGELVFHQNISQK